jgi:hypothetical protein
MAFFPTERQTCLSAYALTNASTNRIPVQWPLDGTGWLNIRLTFHALIDWTNAVVVDRHAIYNYLKSISLRTSRGEEILVNVPGRALYHLDSLLDGKPPVHNIIIGADGTYTGVLDIPLCYNFLNRKEDMILDSGRYSNIELIISTGSVLDFLNDAVGETVAVTMDVEVEKTLATLHADNAGKPIAHTYIRTYNQQVVTAGFWDLESSLDLGLFGFFAKLQATGAPGPFEGAGVDHLTTLTFRDSVRRWLDGVLPWSMQQERHQFITFDPSNIYLATPADTEQVVYPQLGIYPHLFVRHGSINEQYACGKKSLIRLEIGDATNTDLMDLCVFGFRSLR